MSVVQLTPNAFAAIENHKLTIACELMKLYISTWDDGELGPKNTALFDAVMKFLKDRLNVPNNVTISPADLLNAPGFVKALKRRDDQVEKSKQFWMNLVKTAKKPGPASDASSETPAEQVEAKPAVTFSAGQGVRVCEQGGGEGSDRTAVVLAYFNRMDGKPAYLVQFDSNSYAVADASELKAL